jgi:methylamine dehydrogenase heavy chain
MSSVSNAEDFKPEVITTRERIDPGPNVFVNQMEIRGPGALAVFSRDTLAFKGLISAGTFGQMYISPDSKTAYTANTYMRRAVRGEVEQTLEIYDVATMVLKKEILLPPKVAQALSYTALLQESAQGKYMFVQNATPATSITVVDPASGQVMQEIPGPGCYGIYPSAKPEIFSTACGDGTFQTFTLSADGKSAKSVKSVKIFDADTDPVFISSVKSGNDHFFISYGGTVYRLSDADGAIKVADKFQINDGIEGHWAPGGYELLGINEKNSVLFVTMHPDAKEGSQKAAGSEIWAIDLHTKKLLSRSQAPRVASISVTEDEVPTLFGTTEDSKLVRMTADPKAGFALTVANTVPVVGFALELVAK